MPSAKEIVKEIFRRRGTVPDAFFNSVSSAQKDLITVIYKALARFKTEEGKVIAESNNLAQIESISKEINSALFEGEYREALEKFLKEFTRTADLNNEYFEKVFKDRFDKSDKFYKSLTQNSQKQALNLLADNGVDAHFIQPLKQQLTASVTTGASFSETVDALTEFIQGTPEADGTLLRYVKQVARDAYSVSDRQYSNAISDRLGVEWYLYQGGEVADSRDFCIKHHGKYFHKKEIEAMASKDWQGKMKGTNSKTIFAMAGGYNCMHAWLPVSEAVVPQEVIERNRRAGNIE